jgi:hypothetical protein
MRAPRFPLNLPLWFRPPKQRTWQKTRTENISATGVLVRWPEPLPVDTTVEFRLALPSRDPARKGGEIAGHGRVARVIAVPLERADSGFAIKIEHCNLNRTGRAPQDISRRAGRLG